MLANALLINVLLVIYYALQVYFYFLIGSVLLSWLPELRRTKIGQLIDRIADPYMRIFRGVIVIGMFDFTPIIGFLIYNFGLRYFYQMIYLMSLQ
ncbi:YggT family protein [Candidatus Xianfuyuplasma coldseepsis]|uniref:YggT family protein n=1 Tax=Candidatus Xianfuyuplasma coldseepsis TaxID=2782163 RepID=A0A7L7KTT5_9MOLU|nr:YggT family protein [Xianfuyuplasma coldseepsis]QMS85839.1 YggT family protein [Xianfuyuplasma coldseepsis]